jgi:uncharacterized protein
MMLVDANVLIYAVNSEAAHHDESKSWLDGSLSGGEPVGFAWIVLLAFWRIVTHPTLFASPLDTESAGAIIEGWLSQPTALIAQPTPRHLSLLRGLLGTEGTGANLVNDAHLGALALEHGATIVSFDTDFARFGGVRHRRPKP